MSNVEFTKGGPLKSDITVPFASHLVSTEHFTQIYKDGMALVERTASYLDGEGRRDAKSLKPPLSVIYATESMRLTTRLLEVASWLLIQRAHNEGEITSEEARAKRSRVKLRTLGRPSHIQNYAGLPKGLRELIEQSFRITDRVVQLDQGLQQGAGTKAVAMAGTRMNPVGDQIDRLSRAFRRR
jgi:regulator of CtrA degradation